MEGDGGNPEAKPQHNLHFYCDILTRLGETPENPEPTAGDLEFFINSAKNRLIRNDQALEIFGRRWPQKLLAKDYIFQPTENSLYLCLLEKLPNFAFDGYLWAGPYTHEAASGMIVLVYSGGRHPSELPGGRSFYKIVWQKTVKSQKRCILQHFCPSWIQQGT